MLVILAHPRDAIAPDLARAWAPHGAELLTWRDLAAAGWRFNPAEPSSSQAVIGGRLVTAAEVRGVLTLTPGIIDTDLVSIVPEDREYVAAEMTAFLLAWLSSLDCPILNRPHAGCLAGPAWFPEHWLHVAAQLGIPVAAAPAADAQRSVVTVVGERCFGEVDPALAARARRLAVAVGVELLAAQFSGPDGDAAFVAASPWPPLVDTQVQNAVLEQLLGGGGA